LSALCRICASDEPLVSCNNCGSFACEQHHIWKSRSKNAFCVECFPPKLSNSAADTAADLRSLRDTNAEALVQVLEQLVAALQQIHPDLDVDLVIDALDKVVEVTGEAGVLEMHA